MPPEILDTVYTDGQTRDMTTTHAPAYDATYYATQQAIVDAYYAALAASGHADRCATAHWSSGCMGTHTTAAHVQGHVRALGYANAAAAIAACHAAGELRRDAAAALLANGNHAPAGALALLRRG